MADYDVNSIMSSVQQSRKAGLHKELNSLREENETLKLEHGMAKRKLSVYEAREKARTDGLKKAQAARKKKPAAKKTPKGGKK